MGLKYFFLIILVTTVFAVVASATETDANISCSGEIERTWPSDSNILEQEIIDTNETAEALILPEGVPPHVPEHPPPSQTLLEMVDPQSCTPNGGSCPCIACSNPVCCSVNCEQYTCVDYGCPIFLPNMCNGTCEPNCGIPGYIYACDEHDGATCCPSNFPYYCYKTGTCWNGQTYPSNPCGCKVLAQDGTPAQSSFGCNETIHTQNHILDNQSDFIFTYTAHFELLRPSGGVVASWDSSTYTLDPNTSSSWYFNASISSNGWPEAGTYTMRVWFSGSCENGENEILYSYAYPYVPSAPCQTCTSHSYKACYNNDLYWYDSCNQREEMDQDCGNTTYSSNYCYSGDVYRDRTDRGCSNNTCYTSAPQRELVQDCTDGCSDGQCETCYSHHHSSCVGQDVYWFDSCGNQEELKEDCRLYCYEDNQCENGCLGNFKVQAKNYINWPVANATVSYDGAYGQGWEFAGLTNSQGILEFYDIQPGNCSRTYSVKVTTESGIDLGTRYMSPKYEGDLTFNMFLQEIGQIPSLNKISLAVNATKILYNYNEPVTLLLNAKDLIFNPIEGVLIGIIPAYNTSERTSETTNSQGNATYIDEQVPLGKQKYRLFASKPGYWDDYKETTVNMGDCDNDLDCDGFLNDDEIIIGSKPDDYYSDIQTVMNLHYSAQCDNPLSWGFFVFEKSDFEEFVAQAKNLEEQELLEIAKNTENAASLMQGLVVESTSISAADFNSVSSLENRDLNALLKSADEIEILSVEGNVIIIGYDEETKTMFLTTIIAYCSGFFVGSAEGLFSGLSDDVEFGKMVVEAYWIYSQNQTNIEYYAGAAQAFFEAINGFVDVLGNLDTALYQACLGIFTKGAIRANTFDIQKTDDVYPEFQSGYFKGFVRGYLAWQAVTTVVTGEGVASALGKAGGAIAKQAVTISEWGSRITNISIKFGTETANTVRIIKWSEKIIEKSEDAANGLARITKTLGNDADEVAKFFKGANTVEEQASLSAKIEKIANKTVGIIDSPTFNNIIKSIKNSRVGKTILANWTDEQTEGFMRFVAKSDRQQGDSIMYSMRQSGTWTDDMAKEIAKFDAEGNPIITAFDKPIPNSAKDADIYTNINNKEFWIDSTEIQDQLVAEQNLFSKLTERASKFEGLGENGEGIQVIKLTQGTSLTNNQIKSTIKEVLQEMIGTKTILVYDSIKDTTIKVVRSG